MCGSCWDFQRKDTQGVGAEEGLYKGIFPSAAGPPDGCLHPCQQLLNDRLAPSEILRQVQTLDNSGVTAGTRAKF